MLIVSFLGRSASGLHLSVLPDYFIAIQQISSNQCLRYILSLTLALPSILTPIAKSSAYNNLNLKVMLGDDMPGIASRLVSSVQKREVMWNIIEPGDPYDIRKSMIAKLPGYKVPMGQHLELVCLLQAAEIERLCEYLEEYKLKFREVERRELDRHSYQVQIKELTLRIADESNFRAENLKLREFLRKQSAEFEELKKRTAVSSYEGQLVRKYEDALRQAQAFLRENQSLKEALGKARAQSQQLQSNRSDAYYKLQIQFKKLQFENKRMRELVDGKNREIQEFQAKSKQLLFQLQEQNTQFRQLAGTASTIKQYQNRFSLLGQEIQRLNMVLRQKSGELSEAGSRIRVLQEEKRRQGEYINGLEGDQTQIQQHVRQLQAKLRQTGNTLNVVQESRTVMRTYEGNIEKLSAEVQRLNLVLRRKLGELEEANRRISEQQYELRKGESSRWELEDFRSKFSEINRKMAEYQTRIAFSSQEIERLSMLVKRKTDQASSLQGQIRNARIQLQQAQQQVYTIQIEYKSQVTRITNTYQSKITEISRENQVARSKMQQEINTGVQLERLNLLLTNKNAEIQRLQNDLLQSRQRDSTSASDRQKIVQFQQKITLYEQRISQYESQIKFSRQENQQLKISLDQYQKRIMMFSMEIQRLNSVLKKGSPTKQDPNDLKKLAQYENKLAILNQQVQRLNDILRIKDNKLKNYEAQTEQLKLKFDQMSDEVKRREGQSYSQLQRLREQLRVAQQQLGRKNSDQQLTATLNRQNEARMRQIYEENHQLTRTLSQSEHQITVLSHQIERLNGVLKLKVEASDSLEQRVRTAARESDELRKKVAEYENRLSTLAQESEKTRTTLQMNSQYELDSAKRRLQEQERRISQLQTALRESQTRLRNIDSQSRTYEQQIRITYQETETIRNEATRRYGEYQNKLMILSKQIERLNVLLEKFTQQNQEIKRRLEQGDHIRSGVAALQQRVARAVQESEDLRKKLNEAQQAKNKSTQDNQARLRQLTSEKQQQYRRAQEQEGKLAYLIQQLQHSNSLTKDRTDQVNVLEAKVRSLSVENNELGRRLQQLGNANRKIAEYDSKIALLSQEIERLNGVLRGKVEELSTMESRCRNYEIELNNTQRRVGQLENNITRQLQTKNNFLLKQNEDLKGRLRQLTAETGKLPDIENRLALTLGEVERLNNSLRAKTEEINTMANRIRVLQQEVERSRRRNEQLESAMHRQLKNQSSVFEQRIQQLADQNESLRKSARDLSDANRRIPQIQNKVVILSNQIQRLNQILHKYSKEIVPSLEEKCRSLSIQYQGQRRRMVQLAEANKIGQETASRLRIVSQENEQNARRVQEYESRINQISNEVERLNGVLRSKIEQLTNLDGRYRQTVAQNEQLNKKLREASETARRLPQYENKMALLGQEIQRLNGVIRNRGEQVAAAQGRIRKLQHDLESLQRRLAEQESAIAQQKKTRLSLQQKITALSNQNQEMRRALRDLSDSNRRLSDYQSRLALLSQQIERLNGNLRIKTEELSNMDNMFRIYRKESQVKIQGTSSELEDYRRKTSENMSSQAGRLAEYQGKMVMVSKEIERLNLVLKESTYQVQNGQIRQKQCLQQIERLNNTLRLKVEQSARWQQACSQFKLQIRSYEQNLSISNSEYQKLKFQHTQLTEQYQKTAQHLSQYEQSINKLYQEFQRLQSIIQTLKKENYELKVRLQDAGNLVEKNRMLSAEIERLQQLNEQHSADLEELRLALADQSALQKRINEYMALMVVLFAEIESLRRRVKDTERQIETVRRSSLAPFKV